MELEASDLDALEIVGQTFAREETFLEVVPIAKLNEAQILLPVGSGHLRPAKRSPDSCSFMSLSVTR
jgi:hypothetical protein